MDVCIYLLQFARLYNLNINAPLSDFRRISFESGRMYLHERAFYSIFGNSNCKRDKIDNVAAS